MISQRVLVTLPGVVTVEMKELSVELPQGLSVEGAGTVRDLVPQ